MKYYRQYHDETVAEEITQQEAVWSLGAAYKMPLVTLQDAPVGCKLRTPHCWVWKEEK